MIKWRNTCYEIICCYIELYLEINFSKLLRKTSDQKHNDKWHSSGKINELNLCFCFRHLKLKTKISFDYMSYHYIINYSLLSIDFNSIIDSHIFPNFDLTFSGLKIT
jgi:hypothetical protein